MLRHLGPHDGPARRLHALRPIAAVAFLAVLAVGLLVGPGVRPATAATTAGPTAASYAAQAKIERDGRLTVTETWKLQSGSGAFARSMVSTVHQTGDVDRHWNVGAVRATVAGANRTAVVSSEGDVSTISVADVTGGQTLTVAYTVDGAAAPVGGGATELTWYPLTAMPAIPDATIAISTPTVGYVRCSVGTVGSEASCTAAESSTETGGVSFQQSPMPAQQTLQVTAGLGVGQITADQQVSFRHSFHRAFFSGGASLVVPLVLLLLALLAIAALYQRRGRDTAGGQVVPASLFSHRHTGDADPVAGPGGPTRFTPPEDIRPGEVGTLIDERIDPVDVTASVLDLAVRGHLVIAELPRSGEFARGDWQLTRPDTAPAEQLRGYEQLLLDAIGGPGDTVLVSELGEKVRTRLGAMQDALYTDVVERGWFSERPDRTRGKYTLAGEALAGAGLVLTVVLGLTTTWGLLGVAILIAGVALAVVGRAMPAKTAAAGRVMGQIMSVRGELIECDIDQIPDDQRVELCARAVPYAVVLGGLDGWVDALVATDTDDAPDEGFSWYRGPANWHLQHLPDSLRNFQVTLTGALFSR